MFSYDATTGIVAWCGSVKKSQIGKHVGTLTAKGYLRARIRGKAIMVHRLAWILYHGSEPSEFIDHINGNRADNRISNLRLATSCENARNSKLRCDNLQKAKGVSWHKHTQRFSARITFDGKTMNLGYFDTVDSASAAYSQASLKYHGDFSPIKSRRAGTLSAIDV
jgi:hypothetical protein